MCLRHTAHESLDSLPQCCGVSQPTFIQRGWLMSSFLHSASSLASIASSGLESKLRKRLDFPTGSCGVCLPALSRRIGTMATDSQPAHATLAPIASARKATSAYARAAASHHAPFDGDGRKSPLRRVLTRTAAADSCLHRLHTAPKTLSSPVSNVFFARESPVFPPLIRSAKSRRAGRTGPPLARKPRSDNCDNCGNPAHTPRGLPPSSPRYPCEPLASRLPPERAACPRAAGPLGYGSQPSHGTRGEAQQ